MRRGIENEGCILGNASAIGRTLVGREFGMVLGCIVGRLGRNQAQEKRACENKGEGHYHRRRIVTDITVVKIVKNVVKEWSQLRHEHEGRD
jgi:hypothetical protein